MPRNPKSLDAPRVKTPDHYGAAHLSISKNDAVANIKILSGEINKAEDSTVLRVASLPDKNIIYFRAESKSQGASKSKNKTEIEENRKNMQEFLKQTVKDFKNIQGDDISIEQRNALKKLSDLAASGRDADITVGDVKAALGEMTKTKRELKLEKLKKDHQTPKRTESQSRKLMLNRFGVIDQLQKENLKKLLFFSGSNISEKSQDQSISNMQSLVAMQLKNPKASLGDLIEKCQDKEKIEKFVDAWLSFRVAEKNSQKNPLKNSAQFVWAETMDVLCAELKRSVFSTRDQTKDKKNQRVILVDSPISPVIKKKMATPGPALTPQVAHTARKKKISAVKRNSLEHKPILQNKKATISPASVFLNAKNGSPVSTNFISSFTFKLDDTTATDDYSGLMRRTESGDLERQFVFYEVAAAEAKAKSVLAKMRLERLYLGHTYAQKSPTLTAMPVTDPIEENNVRSFTAVRDQIIAASSTSSTLPLSPLPPGATLATVFGKNTNPILRDTMFIANTLALAISPTKIGNLADEQGIQSDVAPVLIYAAEQPVSSTPVVNNN